MKDQNCFWHKKYLLPRRSKSYPLLSATSTSVNSWLDRSGHWIGDWWASVAFYSTYLPLWFPNPPWSLLTTAMKKIQAVERQLRDYVIHGNMSVISNFTLECQDIPHPWRYKAALLLFWHEQIIAHFRAHIPRVVCERICVCACRYFPAITQLSMSFFWTLVFAPIGICYLNSSFVSFFCYRVIHVSVVFVFLFKTILIL